MLSMKWCLPVSEKAANGPSVRVGIRGTSVPSYLIFTPNAATA